MKYLRDCITGSLLPAALLLAHATSTLADGMVPKSSVVILEEANTSGTAFLVTNTDPHASLLAVFIENLPEDQDNLLVVQPTVTRVEAGHEQQVLFHYVGTEPLKEQRLKRVIFEGIREQAPGANGSMRVSFGVRQNLPVILHPKGLAKNRSPWEGLTWHVDGNQLRVENNTPYVVRLGRELLLNPGQLRVDLPRSYVLANEHVSLELPTAIGAASSVRFQPATVYGYATDPYEAAIQ
ncbi:Chaperone protein caf1M precursor [compost metagenome]|jgi:P pilus assembly chaperone PapD|uniref:fimbria/pilus chaperone family protein n=1 Tax=Pseudomonas TaxID=286 RepID=UPI0003FA117A|nr:MULTISPECIES: fimbria/pilus chaperone family protein [Pseudomonas]MCW2267539.1 P pilus assembly chaperone PapD [Pseudomonas sp. JUb96]PRA61161.1 fimbrial chaperone protein [Pseudomonas sp. MYb187]